MQVTALKTAMRIQRLAIGRLVLLTSGFGLGVSALVLLVLGVIQLFTGDLGVIRSVPTIAVLACVMALIARWALPRIDRRLIEIARNEASPELAIPLLELINGLPIGTIQGPLGEDLARSLAAADRAWWNERAAFINPQASGALSSMEKPTPLKPRDGPWIPALLDALARCGRTEFLGRIEKVESRAASSGYSIEIRESLSRCRDSLQNRARRDREAATLLRSAEGGDDLLLRPAAAGSANLADDRLLRPAGEPAASRTAEHASFIVSSEESAPAELVVGNRVS